MFEKHYRLVGLARLTTYLIFVSLLLLFLLEYEKRILGNFDVNSIRINFFNWINVRILLSLLISLVLGFLSSVRSFEGVYNFGSFWLSFRHLIASVFYIFLPKTKVSNGKLQITKKSDKLISFAGGAGYINIDSKSAILIHYLSKPNRVISDGKHFIRKFETIKEIATLGDIEGDIPEIDLFTKDGIAVRVKDVHFCYHLIPSRSKTSPIPPRSIKQMAYNRPIREDELSSLHSNVQWVINGIISDYIKSHQLDQLITPGFTDADPRTAIKQALDVLVRKRLRDLGVELRWADIGHFGILDKSVHQQIINAWGTTWDSETKLVSGAETNLISIELSLLKGFYSLLKSTDQYIQDIGIDQDDPFTDNLKTRIYKLRSSSISRWFSGYVSWKISDYDNASVAWRESIKGFNSIFSSNRSINNVNFQEELSSLKTTIRNSLQIISKQQKDKDDDISYNRKINTHEKRSRMLKVFLCHSIDDKPKVREVYRKLKLITNINPWLDEENILPGEDWNKKIIDAVKQSDVFLVFLTNTSISKEGYVQKEIAIALDVALEKPEGTIYLIPLRLDDCEVPDRLSNVQWLDYFKENSFETLISSLSKRANKLGIEIG